MWFIIISTLLLIISFIPNLPLTHWFFRIFEYGKIQIVILQLTTLISSLLIVDNFTIWIKILQALTFISVLIHIKSFYKYNSFYKTNQKKHSNISSKKITVISANVFQENKEYEKFINLIHKYSPDIFLTMESDKNWEKALSVLDLEYPYSIKIGLNNTYGMHFYSKLQMTEHQVHYFVADDLPSIEAKIKTNDNFNFTFFAIHPPPPSPTEEENSKERDGELLSVAKKIKANANTTVVLGDFNNVAWAKSSILFRKTSETIDGRIGRGFISSYHTKYWFLRFPIDLMFHTADVFVEELKTLETIDSDHFPIYSTFFINKKTAEQQDLIETLEQEEHEIVQEVIVEGINEKSDNRK